MKQLFLLLSFLIFSSHLSANMPSVEVVKVFSYPCNFASAEFAGSGTLFSYRGKTYVLTSEHVVLHGNKNICHSIEIANGKHYSVKLVLADWGYGAALLETQENVPGTQDMASFFDFSAIEQARVLAVGYPRRTNNLIQDEGYILSISSERPAIPLLKNLVEVKGAHVEFGMSGGALLSKESGQYLGLITHQALESSPEGATSPSAISKGKAVSDHFFVISANAIAAWVHSVLASPNSKATFVRSPQVQILEHNEIVFSNGLRFEFAGSLSDPKVGGAEGVGRIGGAEGVGREVIKIGGAEGVGRIGGKEETAPSTCDFGMTQNFVRISNAFEENDGEYPFPGQELFLEKVKRNVLLRKSVCIPYFLSHQQGTYKKVPFYSLAHFIQLLQDKTLSPVSFLVSFESGSVQIVNKKLTEHLNADALELNKILGILYVQPDISNSVECAAFFSQIKTLSELLQSQDSASVPVDFIASILSRSFESARQELFVADFDTTVRLQAKLSEILDTLKKVRL